MLNPNRLERLAAAGNFDRLLSDVLRNGRVLPLAARLRLSEAEALPASALGLTVQRLLELSRRPTAAVCAIVEDLLDRQQESGGFGSVAATAVATSALSSFSQLAAFVPGAATAELAERARRGLELSLHHLFEIQSRCYGVEPAGLVGDGLDSAIVLWQLGHDRAFGAAVNLTDLLGAVTDPEVARDPDAKAVLALAGAGRAPARRPAAAA